MLTAGGSHDGLRLPNTLTLTPNHAAAVIGQILKRIYTVELQNEPDYPAHLKPLIDRLQSLDPRQAGHDGCADAS